MKRKRFLAVLLSAVFIPVLDGPSAAGIQTEAAGGYTPNPGAETIVVPLDGTWRLTHFPQGSIAVEHPDQLKDLAVESIPAMVPGNVELDLARNGVLPADLFFAENILLLRPYELHEWWYVREFPTPEGTGDRTAELRFRGVDCLATYWLNGKEIGRSENALIGYAFDVTGLLNRDRPNRIAVRLRSAVLEAQTKRVDPPNAMIWGKTNMESLWIRKPPHCYGWDIMPRAVSAGLWRPVELVLLAGHAIDDLAASTASVGADRASLSVFYTLHTDLSLMSDLTLSVEGRCGGSVFSASAPVRFSTGRLAVEVERPRLWWPKGYGSPDLYETTTRLLRRGRLLASRTDWIGIRTVELERTESTSAEHPGNFLFKVNGVPILCKGSNWVPADAFHSRDAGRVLKILELFDDLGCNMVRCWGGNVYEDHPFFDFCDRHGILVWQDFAMACAVYPQAPEFLEAVRREAVAVVRALRNHPSLALWSGDNENDILYYSMGLNPGTNRITREVLPEVVSQCDPFRPFLPSSPYLSPETVARRELRLMPENHLWGPRDYYKSRFYTEHTAHFVSEIGYHGCPGISSIRRFTDAEHVWPWTDNPQWILHSTDMTGDPYRVRLMANQVREMFGEIPDNPGDFIVASQVSQAEAKKFFVEMTRLGRWQRTGVLWWNVMDGWPQFSDAVVDYYFNKKLAYHYLKRVQVPVLVAVDEPADWHVRVTACNDSREAAEGSFSVRDADTDELLLAGDFRAPANTNRELGKIPVARSDKRLLLIRWTAGGKPHANHYLMGSPPFHLAQYRRWMKKIAGLLNDFDPERVGE